MFRIQEFDPRMSTFTDGGEQEINAQFDYQPPDQQNGGGPLAASAVDRTAGAKQSTAPIPIAVTHLLPFCLYNGSGIDSPR
jgi:hypothetical protein